MRALWTPLFLKGRVALVLLALTVNGFFVRETLSRVTPQTPHFSDPSIQSEHEIENFVNQFRKMHGLGELKLDPKMIQMARSHSLEMRDEHYFSHSSPFTENQTPTLRFQKIYSVKDEDDVPFVGENLFWLRDPGYRIEGKEVAEYAENGFLGDSDYRDNLLDPHFKKMGIGVIRKSVGSEEAQYWVTLNLAN